MAKNVGYYLKGESPGVAIPILEFYQFAKSKKLTIEDLNEHSWPVAARNLVNYKKYGSGGQRHETLISYYNSWKDMRGEV